MWVAPRLACPSSPPHPHPRPRQSGGSHCPAVVNAAAVSVGSLRVPAPSAGDARPEVGPLDPVVVVFLICSGISILFPEGLHNLQAHPQHTGSQSPASWPAPPRWATPGGCVPAGAPPGRVPQRLPPLRSPPPPPPHYEAEPLSPSGAPERLSQRLGHHRPLRAQPDGHRRPRERGHDRTGRPSSMGLPTCVPQGNQVTWPLTSTPAPRERSPTSVPHHTLNCAVLLPPTPSRQPPHLLPALPAGLGGAP